MDVSLKLHVISLQKSQATLVTKHDKAMSLEIQLQIFQEYSFQTCPKLNYELDCLNDRHNYPTDQTWTNLGLIKGVNHDIVWFWTKQYPNCPRANRAQIMTACIVENTSLLDSQCVNWSLHLNMVPAMKISNWIHAQILNGSLKTTGQLLPLIIRQTFSSVDGVVCIIKS